MGSNKRDEAEARGKALHYLSELISQSGRTLFPTTGDNLLQSIVDAAGQIFGAAAASILLIDFELKMLEFKVSYGHGKQQLIGQRIPLDSGIAGYVVMTGQPIAIADVQQDPRFNQDFARSTGYVPKSILATPLEWQERVIGVMEVLDKIDAPRFDLHDMEMLGLFATQASIAIVQSQQSNVLGEALLLSISTWVEQDAPDDLRPTLEQLIRAAGGDSRMGELAQLTAVLYELLTSGEAEREMTLVVLGAIRDYVVNRPKHTGL